jgi:hypothetical protein
MTVWCAAWLLVWLGFPVGQKPTEPPPPEPPLKSASPGSSSSVGGLDKLPLPDGSVIVLTDDLRKALGQMPPGAVVLSPERYRALLEKARQADAQPGTNPMPPMLSACRLTGQIVRDAAGRDYGELKAELEFRTTTENARVPIGLRGLRLTKALLDGDTPVWGPEADGLTVLVKEPKSYQLALHFTAPVSRTGLERRILVERLPASVVTSLDLTVPESVQAATVRGVGPVTVEPLEGGKSRVHAAALGVLDQLDLTWQTAQPAAQPGAALLTLTGDQRISLDEGTAFTDIRLRVEVRQGALPALRIRLPGDAGNLMVEEEGRPEPLEWTFTRPGGVLAVTPRMPLTPGSTSWTLRLRFYQTFEPKPGRAVALGLCEVLDAPGSTQKGTVALWLAPDVRVSVQHQLLRVDPRDVAQLEGRPASYAFRYVQQPVRLDAVFSPGGATQAYAEVRTNHVVRLTEASLALVSEIEFLRVTRPGVQELEIRWPRGLTFDRRVLLGGIVESARYDAADGVVRCRLAGRQTAPFKLRLEGLLDTTGGEGEASRSATLDLPAVTAAGHERAGKVEPAEIIRRDGEFRILGEGLEVRFRAATTGVLTATGRPADLNLPLELPRNFAVTAGAEQPARVALTWRVRPPAVESFASAYVTSDQVVVRQTLRLAATPPGSDRLAIRLPRTLIGRTTAAVRTRDAQGRWTENAARLLEGAPAGAWTDAAVVLPRAASGSLDLVMTFSQPMGLERGETPVSFQLTRLTGCGDLRSDVGLWASDKVRLSVPRDGAAQAPSTFRVEGESSQPGLVVRSDEDGGVTFLCSRSTGPRAAGVVAERVGLDVSCPPDGTVLLTARYWLAQVRTERIEVRIPGGRPALLLDEVNLDGRAVQPEVSEVEDPSAEASATVLRIPVPPALLARPAELRVAYRVRGPAGAWGWRALRLLSPSLGETAVVRNVRWRVELAPGLLPLEQDSAATLEQPWTFRGWLRPPQPTADAHSLVRWLAPAAPEQGAAADRPAYLFFQVGAPSELKLLLVPQRQWLVLCSVAALAAGLGAASAARTWSRVIVVALGLGLGALALWWPGLMPAILFGIQPGIVVLTILLGVLWLRRRRWRRQVVMLPGFSRTRSHSSLVRAQGVATTPREINPRESPRPVPSTADGQG